MCQTSIVCQLHCRSNTHHSISLISCYSLEQRLSFFFQFLTILYQTRLSFLIFEFMILFIVSWSVRLGITECSFVLNSSLLFVYRNILMTNDFTYLRKRLTMFISKLLRSSFIVFICFKLDRLGGQKFLSRFILRFLIRACVHFLHKLF